jgi:hypothetical protein
MADAFEFILGLPHLLPQREAVSHQLFYRRVDGLHGSQEAFVGNRR